MKEKKNWMILLEYGGFIVLTVAIIWLLAGKLTFYLQEWKKYGYLGVFVISFFTCATVILPFPFAGLSISLAVSLASQTDPFTVALVCALGATLGEGVGYIVGRTGKKILNVKEMTLYQRVKGWLQKHGKWAIIGLSFQPIFPFDILGIIAGTLRYPFLKFLLFCFLGRIPKYLIIVLLGSEILNFFFH